MNQEAVWWGRVERWEQSGLSARGFAEREGFHAASLFSWRKKLAHGPKPPMLVPVRVGSTTPAFEVVIDGHLTVRVPADFDEKSLAKLIQALGGAR